jgi:hypothetical protein
MAVLKLTPITRLSMSFDHELDLDKANLFNEKVYENYISILKLSDKQRDDGLKFVFMVDALIAILLTGNKLSIPWVGVSITNLPAVLEIATLFASVAFFFTAMFFTNAVCYAQVVDQFKIRAARTNAIDPDFLAAADKLFHFPLKIFRSKMNIWGVDFYSPRFGFKAFAFWLNAVTLFIFFEQSGSRTCRVGVCIGMLDYQSWRF